MPDDADFRWPTRGDRPFRAASDWERAVTFSDHHIARDAHIWSGYMRAGAVLIEECERHAEAKHDLIYPLLFCYRHALETAIKWIIDRYARYSSVGNCDPNHHDLWKLWRICRQIIEEVGSREEGDTLAVVEQVVKDFHVLDAGSFAFRYSRKKDGGMVMLPDSPIDLPNVKGVMEAVDHFFTGADGQLDHNTSSCDWKRDRDSSPSCEILPFSVNAHATLSGKPFRDGERYAPSNWPSRARIFSRI